MIYLKRGTASRRLGARHECAFSASHCTASFTFCRQRGHASETFSKARPSRGELLALAEQR